MESSEQTELISKIETGSSIGSRLTALGEGGKGVEGLSKKEKALMDTDNTVVTAGWRGYKQVNGNRKNTIKNTSKKFKNITEFTSLKTSHYIFVFKVPLFSAK